MGSVAGVDIVHRIGLKDGQEIGLKKSQYQLSTRPGDGLILSQMLPIHWREIRSIQEDDRGE
jgi:hypothetical protein